MEYCPGGDLLKLISDITYFSDDQARLYFGEMIMSVHSLHSLGFIHRDLKPDNFLIDNRGHIKLADFGLSKQDKRAQYHNQRESLILSNSECDLTESDLQSSRHLKLLINVRGRKKPLRKKLPPELPQPNSTIPHFKAHSCVGTPPYMSPEIIANQTQGYGKEVDWWSLGCVFYEMFTGCYPFEGQTEEEIFEKVKQYTQKLPEAIELLKQAEHSDEAIDLVTRFLSDPITRLGTELKIIQSHDFFKDFDWDRMREISPEHDILIVLKATRSEMDIEVPQEDLDPGSNV